MSTPVRIVFFSSVTENTRHFVEKLGYPAERIPLRRGDADLHVDYPYVLFVPSYGGGHGEHAVPKQVIKFLNDENNRKWCLGSICGGNVNFYEHYGIAGRVIAKKLGVPNFYNFELRGDANDVEKVTEGLLTVFGRYDAGELAIAGDVKR